MPHRSTGAQQILFISDLGKYVQSLTLTESMVCDCDLLRFCGAAGHFDKGRLEPDSSGSGVG